MLTEDGIEGLVGDHAVSNGRYNRTDLGNAERLLARYGHMLRYVHPWSKWLVWDHTRWKIDDTGLAERLAQETVRQILAEALALDADQEADARKKLISHAFASERAARIRGLLELARSRDNVPALPAQLDADPQLLNVRNGTLDLRTLELRPHDKADLITKLAPVDYRPDATAHRWLSFLDEIFEGDAELVSFVQRAAGYSLTGDTSAQVFFLLHGSGANGKTTLIETLAALTGDYGQQAPADTFLERRHAGIPNDIARLQGVRFVAADETDQDRRFNEALVKRITGGDRIAARYMRSEFFEFTPQFKLWLATNHKPQIRGTDHAIWRRIRLVPFTRTFDKTERDEDLKDKLRTELSGILNWAIEGLRNYSYGDRLEPPQAVTNATDEYREEQDTLGAFLEEHTCRDPGNRVRSSELYKRYRDWCAIAGERPETQTAFGLRLKDRGLESIKTMGRVVWTDLRFADEPSLLGDTETVGSS